jgi:adenosylcobinamide hydrolase
MFTVLPTLSDRLEDGIPVPVLVWAFPSLLRMISSGPLGGGIGERRWVLNATVPMSYARTDPDAHLAEMAADLQLGGPGVGLMTGVDVTERIFAADGAVEAVATVGLGSPAWAAAPDGHVRRYRPGTINTVVRVPVRLSDAALVNAIATVAEAKAQALWEVGVDATGTASDATCIVCEPDGPAEPYGGPRSIWGARIARAVHTAVRDGCLAWQRSGTSWSDRNRAAILDIQRREYGGSGDYHTGNVGSQP